jgi:hypothetical protein
MTVKKKATIMAKKPNPPKASKPVKNASKTAAKALEGEDTPPAAKASSKDGKGEAAFSKEEQTLLKRRRKIDKVVEVEEEEVIEKDKDIGESHADDGSFYSDTYAQDAPEEPRW